MEKGDREASAGPAEVSGRSSPGTTFLNPTKEVTAMPVWAWVLLIILLVLLVTGGVGYRRR